MYLAVSKSIVRLCQDIAEDLTTRSVTGRPVTVVDLDGHGSLGELPADDLIAPGSIEVTDHDKMCSVTFSITVLTLDDEGIHRLRTLINHIFRRLKTESKFVIYEPDTGALAGVCVVKSGTEVSPVSRAEVRNAISVVVSGEVVPGPSLP
jgi:hypothetical protein